VPEIRDEAYQFGILYVLEGSRLGAGVLARAARASGDRRIVGAMRFLCHGNGQGFWTSFLQHLEASRSVFHAPHEAVAGALSAFALFAVEPALPCAAVTPFAAEMRDGYR
jgi:heme oxygenase